MDGHAPDGSPRIRVLLADDHGVVRRGLRGFFELLDDIEIVGEAEDGRQAVNLTAELAPDVVLRDLLMPNLDGIGATAEIKARFPDVEVARLLAQRIRSRQPADELHEPLTERGREVLALAAKGRSNKEIATELAITERTARTHVSNILGKLDLASRTQAALWAIEHRLT